MNPLNHHNALIEYFKSAESRNGFDNILQWLNYFCKKVVMEYSPKIQDFFLK